MVGVELKTSDSVTKKLQKLLKCFETFRSKPVWPYLARQHSWSSWKNRWNWTADLSLDHHMGRVFNLQLFTFSGMLPTSAFVEDYLSVPRRGTGLPQGSMSSGCLSDGSTDSLLEQDLHNLSLAVTQQALEWEAQVQNKTNRHKQTKTEARTSSPLKYSQIYQDLSCLKNLRRFMINLEDKRETVLVARC